MKAKRTKRKRAQRVPRRIDGLADRLKLTFDSFGTVSAVATAISRSEGALRKWIRAESEPSASDLRSICEVTGTPIVWLLFGEEASPGSATKIVAKGEGEK